MSSDGERPGSEQEEVPQVRLTDDGLETPDHLVGVTGSVQVELPEIKMTQNYTGDGVPEYSELLVFPTTDKDSEFVPEGHARIAGTLYDVVDDRDTNECPECGSDKIDVLADPVVCYDCAEDPVEVHP